MHKSLNTSLAGKADSSHTHDDRYYTESEIDTLTGDFITSVKTNEDGQLIITKGGADTVVPFEPIKYSGRIIRIYGQQEWKPAARFNGSTTIRFISKYYSYEWTATNINTSNVQCTVQDYEHGGSKTILAVEQDEFVQMWTSISIGSGNGGVHKIEINIYRNGTRIGACESWTNGFQGYSDNDTCVIAVKKGDTIEVKRSNYNAGSCNYTAYARIRFCETKTGWALPE